MILHHDQSETGPRVRRTLTEKHGITPELVRDNLYTYVRPSDQKRIWFVEKLSHCPPDVQVWDTWVLSSEPTDEQIIANQWS